MINGAEEPIATSAFQALASSSVAGSPLARFVAGTYRFSSLA